MTWHLFRVMYELHSPLHIGYHKVGNVQRTRYYIPARNLWAAVTERLTRSGFSTPNAPQGDYQRIGDWVKRHCAFGYFFVCDGDTLLYPHYAQDGLCYGHLSAAEFERRWLSAHVTTALDAATTSAETGSLHEVEFIAPHYRIKDGNEEQVKRTSIGGWVFLSDEGVDMLGDEAKWRARLGDLQVGGERRYGFGRLRLRCWTTDQTLADVEVTLDGLRPQISVQATKPLLAHTLACDVKARGMIEPLVGRETVGDSRSVGQRLTRGQVCWVPGSVVEGNECVTLDETGVWIK
jgi:hypothetical protein